MRSLLSCSLCVSICLSALQADANLVGLWISNDYTNAGDPWVDRINSISATPANGPQPNALGVLFDGVDDQFSVTSGANPIGGLSAFTATAIFTADGNQGGSDRPNGFSGDFWQASHLVGIEQAGGGAGDWGVGINGAQNIVVGTGLEGDDTLIDNSQAFNDGSAHIVTMVMDDVANQLRLFVDGALVDSTSVNPNTGHRRRFLFRYEWGACGDGLGFLQRTHRRDRLA